MTEIEILGRLSQILGDLLGDDTIVLTPDTTREDVPGWDSFIYLTFIVAAEKEFGIKLGLAEVEDFETAGAVAASIQQKTS